MTRPLTRTLTVGAALLLGSAFAQKSLVYGMGGDPVSLDSGTITDGNSALAQTQVYDTLVKFKPGTSELAPGLALRWSANAAATEWTFTLRPGVKFSDGTPLNADAVIYNVNRWWDPAAKDGAQAQNKTFTSWLAIYGSPKGAKDSLLKEVRKVGSNQVVFVLSRSFAPFPQTLAVPFFGVASPTAVAKGGNKYGSPASLPVGSGPFIMQSWKTGDRIALKPNPSYWGTKAKYDQLVLRFIKDPSQRLNELKAGTLDFTSDLSPEQLNAVKSNPGLNAIVIPSFNTGLIALNTKNKYLSNDKVRQAISMAINKKAIVDAFWNDLGVTDASILPPALAWANSKSVPADYKYDPAAAKKLLSEAGYPSGFAVDFWYMPVSRPYFPNPKPIAEAMAADLSAIGIKANLKTEDWGKYLSDRDTKNVFDIHMIGWTGPYADPYTFYAQWYDSNTSADTQYFTPQLESLMAQAVAAKTRPEAAKAYGELQELTYKAGARIPIVHSRPLAAAASYVKNWLPGPNQITPFETITIDAKK